MPGKKHQRRISLHQVLRTIELAVSGCTSQGKNGQERRPRLRGGTKLAPSAEPEREMLAFDVEFVDSRYIGHTMRLSLC